MHQLGALFLLLVHAMQSASLVLSNMPRSNSISPGIPQIIRPANVLQAQNRTDQHTWGTYHDIGSNLTIYIILTDIARTQALSDLLLLAKEQVHDRATLFGPTTPVPHRRKNPDLTQTIRAGLVYYIEPSRTFSPRYPGLEWGEFEVATSWLYDHRSVLLNHRECTFILFRRISVKTGQELNVAFGAIKPLNLTTAVDTAPSRLAKLPAESLWQSSADAN